MKVFTVLAFASSLAACSGIPFDSQHYHVFIVRGGAQKNSDVSEEEAHRARKAIFHAVQNVEQKVHKAVANEVDHLFHRKEHDDKKTEVAEKAKKVVAQGAEKVKKTVEEHDEEHGFPYAWPHHHEKAEGGHKDHRILHAVESAEKAVLHAVEAEVDSLFHELKHHDDESVAKKAEESAKKAKHVVKKGVKKATKTVEDTHEHRRSWLAGETDASIEDYIKIDFE